MLFLQRTGQTLPTAIQTAFKWLKLNALDQVRIEKYFGFRWRKICAFVTNQVTTHISVSGWIVPKIGC